MTHAVWIYGIAKDVGRIALGTSEHHPRGSYRCCRLFFQEVMSDRERFPTEVQSYPRWTWEHCIAHNLADAPPFLQRHAFVRRYHVEVT